MVDLSSLKPPSPDFGEVVDISDDFDDSNNSDINPGNREHFDNLCDELDEMTLMNIGQSCHEAMTSDDASRSDWKDTLEKGLNLIGLKIEDVSEPFEGACGAHHPLILEAAIKFQSKASAEILPADGPCKTKIYGTVSLEKEEKAKRIRNFLNYFILEEMAEYYPDTERLLFTLPLFGSGFKKSYFDGSLNRPVSEYVPAHQVIVPNTCSSLDRAPRYTHRFTRTVLDLRKDIASGFYCLPPSIDDIELLGHLSTTSVSGELGSVAGSEMDLQGLSDSIQNVDGNNTFGQGDVLTICEQYCSLFVPELEKEDYYKENKLGSPYIVTFINETQEVIGIRRNYDPEDDRRKPLNTLTHYCFVPGFGFYGYGFIHLLGNIQLALTSTLRSLIDSGMFANLQGGFRLKGVRMMGDGAPMRPGEFKYIESPIMDINKSLMPLTFKEPSQVLFALMEFLDVKGMKFADSTEQIIQESNNMGPVGTTLALLDASAKFFNAIHKRLHFSQKSELKSITRLLKENFDSIDSEILDLFSDSETNSDIGMNSNTNPESGINSGIDPESGIKKSDFNLVSVIPHSDPNISSAAHRMTKAQTVLQMALQTPDQHDMRKVLKHVYTNMDYLEPDSFLKEEDEASPLDPLSDIARVVQGKPIRAFEGQDHVSHIGVKESFLQDPASGGSLYMQKVRPFIEANITEHYFLKFKAQIDGVMMNSDIGTNSGESGMNSNINPDSGMSSNINTESPEAQAAKQVAAMNQKLVEQQTQQPNVQDQATMLVAQADAMRADTASRKLESDEAMKALSLTLENERIQLEKFKILSDIQLKDKKLAADLGLSLVKEGLDDLQERARLLAVEDRHKEGLNFQKENSKDS